jgi:hypothetical protein
MEGQMVEVPIETMSLGFEVSEEADGLGEPNHMARPTVTEVSRFFRLAGFVWR